MASSPGALRKARRNFVLDSRAWRKAFHLEKMTAQDIKERKTSTIRTPHPSGVECITISTILSCSSAQGSNGVRSISWCPKFQSNIETRVDARKFKTKFARDVL